MKVIFNKIENKKLILDLENFKCIKFFMYDKRIYVMYGVILCIYWVFFKNILYLELLFL